ncbi:MAG: chaperone NapD [Spirochaetia bacterium]|nr:chaperone NapD [Spirochaetia bacterium]
MPVSSLIVEFVPDYREEVTAEIAGLKGAEITESGSRAFIVVTDTATIEEDRYLTGKLVEIPHVISANVVFTNMEDSLAGGDHNE